jgi:hypothetical protein
MDRDFRKGYLEIGFSTEPFDSAPRLLVRSTAVFLANLPFLAGITLLVVLPAKLAIQFACYGMDVPTDGTLSYFVMSSSDLLLEALLAPAIVYALVAKFRTGRLAPLGETLRWGRRQWLKTLWNEFRAEVTVGLYTLLLLVPGVICYVKLIFTETIVAIEGDLTQEVLGRSRRLTEGHRWRILGVVLPLGVLNLGAGFLVLNALRGATHSRLEMAAAETALTLIGLWGTVAALLMYLGIVGGTENKENGKKWKSR